MIRQALARLAFGSSPSYWERRYRNGGNSGAGSYGRLAEFKAEVINGFVKDRGIQSVVEYGCGDGAQLALAEYHSYTGVDVSRTVLEQARERFPAFTFAHLSELPEEVAAELALSLDVIYHLVEDETFENHMKRLFNADHVIIYSSNHDERLAAHVRHRNFTKWIEENRPQARLLKHIPNRYPYDPANDQTSFADFYIYDVRPGSSPRP